MTTDGIRYTTDLININEKERDIIIDWAQKIIETVGMSNEEQLLRGRFVEWKEAEEIWRKRKERLDGS